MNFQENLVFHLIISLFHQENYQVFLILRKKNKI